jgi:hypothetical protein
MAADPRNTALARAAEKTPLPILVFGALATHAESTENTVPLLNVQSFSRW